MSIDDVKRIAVIGSGAMGSQIAMVCALAGYQVSLVDISREMLDKTLVSLQGHMKNRVEKGRLTENEVKTAFERIHFENNLSSGVSEADFVIEAIVEKLVDKQNLFADLDELAPPHAILATNSSTIVSSKLAGRTRRPDRVCNMHFFNPALVMKLVEVVRNEETSEDTVDTTVELARRLGKSPITLNKEISGFVANRILAALMNEALDLYEKGIASFEDIDEAVTKGLGHPIGPFALMDLTGIDVNYFVRMQRFTETGNPQDAPRASVREKFEQGHLGRKTGQGWYTYDK